MGGVLDFLGDVIGGALGLVASFIRPIFGDALDWLFEPIMNFLGFEDEEIYATDVIAVKVIDKDFFHETQVRLALNYQEKGLDAITYANNFVKTGDTQFNKFYRYGDWDYEDYLPEGQINAVAINVAGVEDILKELHNDNIFIIDINTAIPNDTDWVKYQLQLLYNYDIGTDFLLYEGTYYNYGGQRYNSSTNYFDVTLKVIEETTVSYYTYTTITVTPIDDTTDNKNTLVESVVDFSSSTTGSIYKTVTTVVSNTDEEVPKGSIGNSYNSVFDYNETVTIPASSITIGIPNHGNRRLYVVKYTTTSDGVLHYWMYDPEDELYPEIDEPAVKSIDFDLLPIVMLRNSFFNVDEFDKTDKNDFSRPPTVTEDRYEDTKNILGSVGLDVDAVIEAYSDNPDIDAIQDAFFMFGVSPSDTDSPVVSKTLNEIFDNIYDSSPFKGEGTSYAMSVKENPFNASIGWEAGPIKIRKGKIGLVGDCTHSFSDGVANATVYKVTTTTYLGSSSHGDAESTFKHYKIETYYETIVTDPFTGEIKSTTVEDYSVIITRTQEHIQPGTTRVEVENYKEDRKNLFINKQIDETRVRTLTIKNFKSFIIIRRGVENGGKEMLLDDKNLVIPLPKQVLDRLTLMEKTSLLGLSAYLIFFAVQHQHLEWYETEKFADALSMFSIVLTIVITIVSLGSLTGPSMVLSEALWALAESIAIGIGLQGALKLISELVDDPFLKMILTVAAVIAAVYLTGGFDNFSLHDVTTLCEIPAMAGDMMLGDITEQMSKLMGERESFNAEYSSRLDNFESINQQMNSGLSAFNIVDLSTNIDMFNTTGGTNKKDASASVLSPSQFYYLALNQAAYNYDLLYTGLYDNTIHKFVANKLRLGVAGE